MGMIKIAKALQDISTMKVFSIGSNNIGHQAADNIAIVLFHNSKLKELYLHNNNFRTEGLQKFCKIFQL